MAPEWVSEFSPWDTGCNFSSDVCIGEVCHGHEGNISSGGHREILPVTVKNVKEMRRFIPQFMLDVKAMARPLIPPGKISLRTSQDTEVEEKI